MGLYFYITKFIHEMGCVSDGVSEVLFILLLLLLLVSVQPAAFFAVVWPLALCFLLGCCCFLLLCCWSCRACFFKNIL